MWLVGEVPHPVAFPAIYRSAISGVFGTRGTSGSASPGRTQDAPPELVPNARRHLRRGCPGPKPRLPPPRSCLPPLGSKELVEVHLSFCQGAVPWCRGCAPSGR
eukprot:scaffold2771_cov252-Pinguiococcus_pyrenoidosus.AAC.25